MALVSTVSWFVRYRFLNMYARLPPEPQRKEPEIDLYPDTQEEGSKSGFTNYLDEFLSAIKVFGYLERPVFHELTRSMQTRKLIAGETLNLEAEKGFCLVVDGLVEIFVKSAREGADSDSDPSHFHPDDSSDNGGDHRRGNGHQGYQLLTEVKNGAPMSSLFSILSLFTEDVKLRHTEDDDLDSSASSMGHSHPRFSSSSGFAINHTPNTPPSLPTSPIYGALSQNGQATNRDRRSSTMASSTAGGTLPIIPPLSLDPATDFREQRPKSRRTKVHSVHPDIVARATVDTTIAIIPASAFRRLTRVYPKATAHIVQVILTRLQRVTLATGHSYLGLTSEVLRTEKHMNKYTTYELPNFLRGDALERLKEKFIRERERIGPEEGSKGIALHNPGAGRRRRSSNSLRKEATLHAVSARGRPPIVSPSTFDPPPPSYRDIGTAPSPGDLLTNIQISRTGTRRATACSPGSQAPEVWPHDSQSPLIQRTFNPFEADLHSRKPLHRQDSIDEDTMFRKSILECIFKAIGLTNTKNALRMSDSVEASPRMISYDQKRQKAVFSNNAFGFIDPYEGSGDGDTESMTSGGVSTGGFPSTQNLAHELRDELEIVYFPKGSVLVEQGERNPGLYYVIDGFLDVSVPSDEKSDTTVLGQTYHPSTLNKHGDETLVSLSGTMTGSSRASGSGIASSSTDGKRRKATGRKSLALIKPGGIAGYIGTISSYRSFIDVVAKTDVYVGFLPRSSLERIVEKYPVVLLTMAKRLTSLLPRLILHIDFALEWVQVNAGQVIYHQGDDSDAIYIVLNGRLRLVLNNEEAGMKVVGEYGQGESVGELEVMTESERPATLHAIRDTELAKFPKTLFNSLAQEHPGITIKISKIIASRMRALVEDRVFAQGKEKVPGASNKKVSSTINLRTVAILPVTTGVPVVEFGSRLMNALTQIGAPNGVTSLNQAAILNHLGRHAFSRMGKLKLSQYLADLEEKYGLVLYVAGKLECLVFPCGR